MPVFLIKIVISKDVSQCLFLVAFGTKTVTIQTFEEQLAILITHHIPAQKSCHKQQKTAHNHTFLHKLRVVNYLIDMQMCEILF